MFSKIFKSISDFLKVSVSEEYKEEFQSSINSINIAKGKTTATFFIVLEVIMLIISLLINKDKFLSTPNVYYGMMYILMIIAMVIYLLLFIKFEKDIHKYRISILKAGVTFAGFILCWCAGISLLDQLSSGQIMVYAIAIIAIAVTPLYKPITLLLIYLPVHLLFLVLMGYIQSTDRILFGNYINSTSFIIISWAISAMRYRNKIEDFNNRRIIQEKSRELEIANKELSEANHKLEKLSQTDSLTGIFNRSVFDKAIKTEWDRCKRLFMPLSLIMIDIDNFKAFNDNYGHQAGDDCIKHIAEALSTCSRRSTDTVARYGGEEFGIILPYMDRESAAEFAENIRKSVEQLAIPHKYSSVSQYVTISLGVYTLIPSGSSSVDKFIKIADKALYDAKKQRNNTVVA